MNLQGINAIIFDLGGVILNIDYHKTIDAFKNLGFNEFEELYSQAQQSDLFDRLDKGTISPDEFRDYVKKLSGDKLTHKQIDDAWNAMLLDLPMIRLHLLEKLNQAGIDLYLLSNTNEIHEMQYMKYVDEIYGRENFNSLFKKVYLSHHHGIRKPHPATFEHVLKENNLSAEHTLFIDDSIQHIEGAKQTGIKTYFLRSPETIEELFEEYL